MISLQPTGTGVHVFATGVRNGDGLAFAPDGTLWTAVNERDNIAYPFHHRLRREQRRVRPGHPGLRQRPSPGRTGAPHARAPCGLAVLQSRSRRRSRSGRNCCALPDPPFDRDAQTNPTGARLDCASLAPIERGLPAHSAPLGFHFLEGSRLPSPWTGGAVVAVHGSWDRQPPRPPAVLWLPWEASTHTVGAPIALISGFQLASGDRWGRPVDVVPGPDGALYVSDDTAGAIYRIVP